MTDQLLQQAWFDSLEQAGMDEQLHNQVKTQLERLAAIDDEFREHRAHIAKDGDLSPNGKTTRLAALSETQGEAATQAASPMLERLSEEILSTELALSERQKPDVNSTVAEMRQSEIRERLLEMSELEIQILVEESGRSGNLEIIAAVQDSPLPILSNKQIVLDARIAAAVRHAPEQAARLAQLRTAHAQLRSGLMDTLTSVDFKEADPLIELAKGEAA